MKRGVRKHLPNASPALVSPLLRDAIGLGLGEGVLTFLLGVLLRVFRWLMQKRTEVGKVPRYNTEYDAMGWALFYTNFDSWELKLGWRPRKGSFPRKARSV